MLVFLSCRSYDMRLTTELSVRKTLKMMGWPVTEVSEHLRHPDDALAARGVVGRGGTSIVARVLRVASVPIQRGLHCTRCGCCSAAR